MTLATLIDANPDGTPAQNQALYQGTRSVISASPLAFASLANGQTFATITPALAADSRTINSALAASTDLPTFCAALALELNTAGTTAYNWTATASTVVGTAKTPGSAYDRAPTGTALTGSIGMVITSGAVAIANAHRVYTLDDVLSKGGWNLFLDPTSLSVSGWTDRSGSANHGTPILTDGFLAPVIDPIACNGHPAVYIGTPTRFDLPAAVSAKTIFAVVRYDGVPGGVWEGAIFSTVNTGGFATNDFPGYAPQNILAPSSGYSNANFARAVSNGASVTINGAPVRPDGPWPFTKFAVVSIACHADLRMLNISFDRNGARIPQASYAAVLAHPQYLTREERYAISAQLASALGIDQAENNLVLSGDSLGAGGWLQNAMSELWPGVDPIWRNQSVGGKTVAQLISDDILRVDPYWRGGLGRNVAMIFAGTNDLNTGTTGAATYDLIKGYAHARRKAGFDRVIVSTIIQRGNALNQPFFDAESAACNTLLRAGFHEFADLLFDPASDGRFGEVNAYNNAIHYLGDLTHLTTTGDRAMSAIAAPVIQRAFTP